MKTKFLSLLAAVILTHFCYGQNFPAPSAATGVTPLKCQVELSDIQAAIDRGVFRSFSPDNLLRKTSTKVVRMIYLVPADREVNEAYRISIGESAKHLQKWYYDQLNIQKSFHLRSPVVEVFKTSHKSDWYSTNTNGDLFVQFWNNVLSDGFAVSGGKFNDPDNIYVFYIDADPACGQCGGCGAPGVVVIGANDLRGMVGQEAKAICPNENIWKFGPCRFVGGLGHELGHALNLPHPPGCDQGQNTCDNGSVMWTGLYNYPNAYFNTAEKESLANHPFITSLNLTIAGEFRN
ncbi:hypothetical protein BH24BAC1_BH24BAC1_38930 [soil metagenome]